MDCEHLKVGAPDWSDLHLIRQLVPKDPKEQAKFRLPGDVKPVGETFAAGIIPLVRLIVPGSCEGEWIAANLHFAEHSSELREDLTDKWERDVDSNEPPEAFQLEVDFGDNSYAELMSQLERRTITRETPAHLMLRLVMGYSGGKEEMISPSFRGLMVATHTDYFPSPPDPGHPWPYFECHSHWFKEPLKKKNRRWFTKCFGDCPTTRCSCDGAGSRHCWGLHFCWC